MVRLIVQPHNLGINTLVETMSLYCLIYSKGKIMLNSIKTFTHVVLDFMCDLGQASYAAHLARNQQWQRAQAFYKK